MRCLYNTYIHILKAVVKLREKEREREIELNLRRETTNNADAVHHLEKYKNPRLQARKLGLEINKIENCVGCRA